MGGGYRVDPLELTAAAGDIEAVASTAEGVQLSFSGAACYGEGGVHDAVVRFCTTWQMALDMLTARMRSASKALDASAHHYYARDFEAGFGMCRVEFPGQAD